MKLDAIGDAILDESSSPEALHHALDAFVEQCSEVSGIEPNPGFDAWADDSLTASGVAINSRAAAHCALDYQRSVVFIRGVHAAINALRIRFPETTIDVLYAGCGPFATLLLPLLGRYNPGELNVSLLDIHQSSLDSVNLLLKHFGFAAHAANTIKADAAKYQHPGRLHLVIAETMQKSLEQEPQVAVTANLAPQLVSDGFFVPQRIEVDFCLSDPTRKAPPRTLASVFELIPHRARKQVQVATRNAQTKQLELQPTLIEIPSLDNIDALEAQLFTRLVVFEGYRLHDYDSQITLPNKCHGLSPVAAGERYRVGYQLGSYPRFNIERLESTGVTRI